MIHIVTLSELPSLVVEQVARQLFLCYGVGAEHSAHEPRSGGPGGLDAAETVGMPPRHSTFADDKTLYLTDEKLVLPSGPLGTPPSGGYALPDEGVGIATSHGIELPAPIGAEEDPSAWLAFADKVARRAIHQVGFLWGLHRCVDLRCAMSAPWLQDAGPSLCDFCRERSEARIHLARS